MSTNKKKIVKPAREKSSRGERAVMVDGEKHLTQLDLARYNLAQSKIQGALQAVGLKEMEIKNSQLEFEKAVAEFEKKMGRLSRERGQLGSMFEAEKAELLELQTELAAAYDVDFAKPLSYDDKTGRLVLLNVSSTETQNKE